MPKLAMISYKSILAQHCLHCSIDLDFSCGRFSAVGLQETILVGHSLENDLLALKISHDLLIDTAVLYQHRRGRSYKIALRVLTGRFLAREIQESRSGHDSIEDARAAMDLALLKIRNDLLVVAAQTGKIVNIKKGQFCAPSIKSVWFCQEERRWIIE